MSSNFDIPGFDYKQGLPKHYLSLKIAEHVFEMSRKELTELGRACNENYKQVLFKPNYMIILDAKGFEEYLETFVMK